MPTGTLRTGDCGTFQPLLPFSQMDLAELRTRIDHWENLHTEFKVWPVHLDDLAAVLVAFANTDGGELVLGAHVVRNPWIYT